jgi:hypothetical protein
MDLLSAVLACSLYADPNLVAAMAVAHSHGNPYTVLDASAAVQAYEDLPAQEGAGPEPTITSVGDGIAAIERISAQGGAPLVGLLPVPQGWAALFQRSVAELFDPCVNIAIASAMLSNFEYECGARASRGCAMRKYAQAVGLESLADAVTSELSSPRVRLLVGDAETRVQEAPIFAGRRPKTRAWGPDRIFFKPLAASGQQARGSSPAPSASRRNGDRAHRSAPVR